MTAEFARTLSNGRAGFPELLAALEAQLESHDLPPGPMAQVMIAFDEIVSNVLDHGGATTVEVRLTIADDHVSAEVADDGEPFDPLAAPPPDTALSLDDRAIGGLGIHIVRKLMDEVAYAHEAGRNRLRFSKNYTLD
jgi:anti-sigma regulatory factor (Ser/Thr protein kinase)